MAIERKTEKLDFEKVWLMFQETDRKFQETKELMAKSSLETDRKFQETKELLEKSSLQTEKKLRKLETLFTSQWGKLMETLVEGDLIKLLNERGIKVHQTSTRIKGTYQGKHFEFDIIAENGDDIVVVEVKTTLKTDDVQDFIDNLKEFKKIMPRYSNNNVIGAVAYLKEDSKASEMAQNKGLLVIRATGSSASIVNPIDFLPKAW